MPARMSAAKITKPPWQEQANCPPLDVYCYAANGRIGQLEKNTKDFLKNPIDEMAQSAQNRSLSITNVPRNCRMCRDCGRKTPKGSRTGQRARLRRAGRPGKGAERLGI